MRAADLVTAAVLMGLGGVVLADAVRLGIGWGTDGPKSGFFPFWLAVFLLATCVLILVQAARRSTTTPFVNRERLTPVLKVLLPAAGLVLATALIGLYVASAAYLALYMRWIGGHHWGTVVAIAVAVPVATFFIFETWFLVPMPKGPVEAWLGY
jgi:putative tricarboxylic transport membrane protein